MPSVTKTLAALVRRAADSLSTDAPEFEAVWDAIRLARRERIDLSPLSEALRRAPPELTLDAEERSVLYGLLAQDSAIVGSNRDKELTPMPEWSALPEESDSVLHQVALATRDAVDGNLRFRNRVLNQDNRYFAFSPAWEVEAILPEVFGPDDPAIVIGQHLKTLFDEERLVDESAGIFLAAKPATPEVSALLTQLIKTAMSATDLSGSEKTVLSFIEGPRLSQWDSSGSDRAAKVLALVGASLLCEQLLFVAFVNTLIGNDLQFELAHDSDDANEEFSRELYQFAIHLLFNYSVPSALGDSPPRLMDEPAQADLSTPAAQLATTLNALLGTLSDPDRERPFLPPQLLPHLLQLHGIFEAMNEDDSDVFMQHIRAGVQYRREVLRGYAQYELSSGYLLQSVLEGHRMDPVRADDLTYQLGQVWLDASDPDNAVVTYLPLWRGYEEYSTPDAERRRAREYAVLLRSVNAEGFSALADAVAAFFLFSQSLRYRGRLEPWTDVIEIIGAASALADSRHTQTALAFATELARHFGEQLLLLRIANASLRKYEYTAVAGNLPGIGRAHRETVEQDVIESIGESRRAKLSERGFELLVGAHYKISKLQKELIFGVLSDWGGIATEFSKVFEVELNEKFRVIVHSDEYRHFKTARKEQHFLQAHPTLGSFLHLLREYPKLPPSLQLKLHATSTLHTDSSLLSRLERMVSEHRNPAAHAGAYGQQKFQALLRLLYSEHLLPEFIDALKPSDRV